MHKHGFSILLLSCFSGGSVTLYFTEGLAVWPNFGQIGNSCRGQKVHQISAWQRKWLSLALFLLCNKELRRQQGTISRLDMSCSRISC